jgi:hypothetical protein
MSSDEEWSQETNSWMTLNFNLLFRLLPLEVTFASFYYNSKQLSPTISKCLLF